MDKLIKNLKLDKVSGEVEILDRVYKNSNTWLNCRCSVCKSEWKIKVGYISRGVKCMECAKKERLIINQEKRKKRIFNKINEVAKERNFEVIDIYATNEKDINTYKIIFNNKNKDRNGKEYGKSELMYYPFINGNNSKNIMYDKNALTNEEWIQRAKIVHPEYTYDKVNYINCNKSITITCPIHGDFSVIPKTFMKKEYECPMCKNDRKINEFRNNLLKQLYDIYGKEYNFIIPDECHNIKNKIILVCRKHGEIKVVAKNLLLGKGCHLCNNEKNGILRRITFDDFVERSNKVHKNKYIYKIENFRKNDILLMTASCPKHGDFTQNIQAHMKGEGCPKCHGRYINEEERQKNFIERVKKIHGEKYDLNDAVYKKNDEKVKIICHNKDEFGNEHGEFFITPHNLLSGYGCCKCSGNFLDKELFIKRANEIHDGKYDYSKVEYINNRTKVCIICPEHGEFWQTPSSHLNGKGCPICKISHLERNLKRFLDEKNVQYIYQYRNNEIFGKQSLDFYLPKYKIAIECQGEQHYVDNFFKKHYKEKSVEHLKYIQKLDMRKRYLTHLNGIKMVYYYNEYIKNVDNLIIINTLTDLNNLLK